MSNDKITICIATYKRPESLTRCLNTLSQLTIPKDYTPILIIADNDSEESARQAFHEGTENIGFKSYYYVVPERGLATVRNYLLEKALIHQADYIAFMDDDGLVHKDWLLNMIKSLRTYSCDIVRGYIMGTQEAVPPEEFNIEKKHRHGTVARTVPTNNVLFKQWLINEVGLRFDRYFDYTGGEDVDFFERAKQHGAVAIRIMDAVIFSNPAHGRDTIKFKVYRAFVSGINTVLKYRRRKLPLGQLWFKCILRSMGRCVNGCALIIMALFFSHKRNFGKGMCLFAFALGLGCGLVHIVSEPYRYDATDKRTY